jgi:hypothetical protein
MLNWVRNIRKEMPMEADEEMTYEQHQREIEAVNRQRIMLLLGSEQIRQDYRR